MTELDPRSDFAAFFRAVHGFEPFPWQTKLAESVCEGTWPDSLSLPTASGKTAILDVAVFGLAARDGDAPRRIFMTVDRRLVVDQAHRHAARIRDALHGARDGVVKCVADRLRRLAGGDDDQEAWPLLVARLRGGLADERLWCRSPLQPTIVSTTVDQIGSRLLFRGYGVSPRAWPIHAGLVGCDSLVVLDEAHCSEPFRQTLSAIRREQERGGEARSGIRPVQTIELSATPRSTGRTFELSDEDRDHPVLGRRLRASKTIDLATVKGPLATATSPPDAEDALASEIADRLETAFQAGEDHRNPPLRAAAVVNRVDRARRAAALLQTRLGREVDVRLMIGAMRPLDRDRLEAELRDRVGSDAEAARPLVVVATQCLEVGADLDFDLMLSELAPLDALRQRFGRLNRTGRAIEASGAVLAPDSRLRKASVDAEPDPLYATADVATWELLDELAREVEVPQRRGKAKTVRRCDFGIAELDQALASIEPNRLASAQTPSENAPCLLPAHIDAFAQTNPAPAADPEPSLYLHGTRAESTEISICFRSDLPPDLDAERADDERRELAAELAAYCSLLPPAPRECLPVRLAAFRRWWTERAADDADIPSTAVDDEQVRRRRDHRAKTAPIAILVSCRDEPPRQLHTPGDLRPGDTLIVPVPPSGWPDSESSDWKRLLHLPDDPDWPSLDRADEAWSVDHRPQRFRIHPSTLRSLASVVDVELPRNLTSTEAGVWDRTGEDDWVDSLQDWLRRVDEVNELDAASWPSFAAATLSLLHDSLAVPRGRVTLHPVCGAIATARPSMPSTGALPPPLVLPDELTPGASTLAEHTNGVAHLAARFAEKLFGNSPIGHAMHAAGLWHDLGKADHRFQALLRGGAGVGELLAKSPRRLQADPTMRARAGWPRGGRHEAISLAAIEAAGLLDPATDWLALHLVATHHGAARPFLPPFDAPLEPIDATLHGRDLAIEAESMHFADARLADRFWQAVETFGPWGVAFLEAAFRLADARRSEAEEMASLATPSSSTGAVR